MNGSDELLFALRAGYSLFYAQTYQMQQTTDAIVTATSRFTSVKTGEKVYNPVIWDLEKDQDPEVVLDMLANGPVNTILVAKNYHWFMRDDMGTLDKNVVSFIQNRLELFSSTTERKALVIVGDARFEDAIPEVLQRDFMQIEFGLPDTNEIRDILDDIIDSAKESPNFVMPDEDELGNIVLAARGLTARDVKNAFAYSIIKDGGELNAKTVSIIQARDIEKTAGLKIGEYDDLDSLKGYDNVKDFTTNSVGDKLALGVILLGPPGTGKTSFARWLAARSGMKCIEMEMAQMMGEGLVGQAQNAMRDAIEVIKANAPCMLFIDEIEKGLAGASSKGSGGDGGATKQSMGQFLKFLSDGRPEGVYVIATCNNISALDPEWVRAERWDCAPFFIDLPNLEERGSIFRYYFNEVYDLPDKAWGDFDLNKDTEGWSGAELKAVCRIAKMHGVTIDKAAEYVVPVSLTMKDEIAGLRKWAENKTIPATIKLEKVSGKRSIDV